MLLVCTGVKLGSVTMGEEHSLKFFQNRVLKKIFGPNGGEVMRDLIGLHYEEFYGLYSSPNLIRVVNSRRI